MSDDFKEIESEKKVLHACLYPFKRASRYIEMIINGGCVEDYFTIPFRKWLFTKIKETFLSKGTRLTRVLIVRLIQNEFNGDDDVVEAYIENLDKIFAVEVVGDEVQTLFEDVQEKYKLREITTISMEAIEMLGLAKENKCNSKQLLNDLSFKFGNLQGSYGQIIHEEHLFQNLTEDLKVLDDKRLNPKKYYGIDTGIRPLTLITGGWQKGELIIVVGRPGQGKSIMLLNFALNAYEVDCNILYVTIEMPTAQQKLRAYSNITEIPYYNIKNTHKMTEDEYIHFRKTLKKYKSRKNLFFFLDAPQACTTQFIESRIRNFEVKTGKTFDLILIDPIYLMKANNSKETDQVGAISWDLKIMARTLNCPVIVASQVNRDGGKRHQLGKAMDTMDAAFSDKLGQNADMMLGVSSDAEDSLKISIMKYRDGEGPIMYLRKEFSKMSVSFDMDMNQTEQLNHYISTDDKLIE